MEFKYDDVLWELNDGPWWDWKDPRNKVYENLIVKEGFEKPTKKFLDDKLKKKQSQWDDQKYERDRASAFPSWQEQLDMQYWDKVNGTNKWQEAVAKVKADNPKPE